MASSGTTTQTLGIITQSAEGYQQLDAQLVSIVSAGSNPFLTHEYELLDQVITSDAWSVETTETLTSVVSATDTPTYEVDIPLESTVNVSESLVVEWTTTLTDSGFTATDAILHTTSLLLTSTVKAWDTFVELSRDIELSSAVTIIDTIDPGVIYNQLEVSTIYAQDIISTGQIEFIVENLVVGDTITATKEATEVLSDTANVEDSQSSWAIQYEELEDGAIVSESFNFEGSIYSDMLTDAVNVIDSIWAKDFGAIAWTMNTKSGALTSYDNFGFGSMAFHGGKLYATSPEGLFELGADNDDGRKIDAYMKRGFEDHEVEEKKRVSDIYVGYTGGELECDVETYDGPEDVYTYEMEYRDADAPRNSRLKVGRGLSSRYWRLAFRNVGGADFQIYDIAVQTAVSRRRL